MDEVVGFIILIIVVTLLDRMMKAGQKRAPPPPAGGEKELEGEASIKGVGRELQDLIAEELGLSLERRPRVLTPPEPEQGHGAYEPPAATREPPVAYDPAAPARRGPRETRAPARLEEHRVRKQHERVSFERPQLEEQRVRERREPVSLERPRRPKDRAAFHERYAVPEPVSTRSEFQERVPVPEPEAKRSELRDRYARQGVARVVRRSKARLPDRPEWSATQKGIIWAEILGSPKGLEE